MATKSKTTVTKSTETTVSTVPTVSKPSLTVITVNSSLKDVQMQSYLFDGREPGRYVLEYQNGGATLPVSVYWTGSEVVA